MRVNDRVVAVRTLEESGFTTGGVHVHAMAGDEGTVEHLEDGLPTVRFDRTGTATLCDPESDIAAAGQGK
jgi:hypothetical protein